MISKEAYADQFVSVVNRAVWTATVLRTKQQALNKAPDYLKEEMALSVDYTANRLADLEAQMLEFQCEFVLMDGKFVLCSDEFKETT